jgi:alpha-D-xyloside xylohydrolase
MKFTDGYWQMRAGMMPHYAAQVHEAICEQEAITVFAPTQRLLDRGHTINQPLLTIRFSSPMENVVRVQCGHHKGRRPSKPEFTLYPQPGPKIALTEDEHTAILASGS